MTDNEQAFFQAYDAFEITLTSGRTLRCKVLSMQMAAYYLRLFNRTAMGDNEAMYTFMEEFPPAVGLQDVPLLPEEMWDLARLFFSHRRPEMAPRTATNKGPTTMQAGNGRSMTSSGSTPTPTEDHQTKTSLGPSSSVDSSAPDDSRPESSTEPSSPPPPAERAG